MFQHVDWETLKSPQFFKGTRTQNLELEGIYLKYNLGMSITCVSVQNCDVKYLTLKNIITTYLKR